MKHRYWTSTIFVSQRKEIANDDQFHHHHHHHHCRRHLRVCKWQLPKAQRINKKGVYNAAHEKEKKVSVLVDDHQTTDDLPVIDSNVDETLVLLNNERRTSHAPMHMPTTKLLLVNMPQLEGEALM